MAGRERRGQVLALLPHRPHRTAGLRDIFVACIDGLSGFAEAIHAAYPKRACSSASCTWCGRRCVT